MLNNYSMTSHHTRSLAFQALRLLSSSFLTLTLIACVATNTTSSVANPGHGQIERVLFVPSFAQFPLQNRAALPGNYALNKLNPIFASKFAGDLTQRGLAARTWKPGMMRSPEEKLLVLVPISFTDTGAGSKMLFRASLLDAPNAAPFWTGEVKMFTVIPNWNEDVVADVASQIVERLHSDKLLSQR